MIAGKGHFTGQLPWIHLPQQWTSDEMESLLLGHTSKKRCRTVFVNKHKYMTFYTENIFVCAQWIRNGNMMTKEMNEILWLIV